MASSGERNRRVPMHQRTKIMISRKYHGVWAKNTVREVLEAHTQRLLRSILSCNKTTTHFAQKPAQPKLHFIWLHEIPDAVDDFYPLRVLKVFTISGDGC